MYICTSQFLKRKEIQFISLCFFFLQSSKLDAKQGQTTVVPSVRLWSDSNGHGPWEQFLLLYHLKVDKVLVKVPEYFGSCSLMH